MDAPTKAAILALLAECDLDLGTGFAWPRPTFHYPGAGPARPTRDVLPLPVQLHTNRRPLDLAAVAPIRDQPASATVQPAGGLYSAHYQPGAGHSFTQRMAFYSDQIAHLVADYGGDGAAVQAVFDAWHFYRLTPDPAARVYVVDRYADVVALWRRYSRAGSVFVGLAGLTRAPAQPRYLSFEAVAADYDAIHLTAAGGDQPWAHHLLPKLVLPHFGGWAHEQTLWLRPAFVEVTEITPEPPTIQATAAVVTDPAYLLGTDADKVPAAIWRAATPTERRDLAGLYLAGLTMEAGPLLEETRRRWHALYSVLAARG